MEKRLRTAVIYRDILLVPGFYFYFRQYLQADSRLSKALGFFFDITDSPIAINF